MGCASYHEGGPGESADLPPVRRRGQTFAPVRVDGYIRVSRVKGREGASFISPDIQRERIEAWTRMSGSPLLEIHTDLDESGANVERPGLLRALQRAEEHESDGVVVAKLDRFARSLTGALEAIKRLDAAGAAFVSVAEGLDPTTTSGKMMMRLMLVLAEFELDRIRDSWDEARRRAVERGVHISSQTPTGYLRLEDGRLTPNPAMAPHIAAGYRMRRAGANWRQVGDHFTAHGVVGPYGNSTWTSDAVRLLIQNRVYLGEARSGQHVNPAAHQAIVDRSTWEAAQTLRHDLQSRSARPALLSGLLRCAGCRYLMSPNFRRDSKGNQIRRYECPSAKHNRPCRERPCVLGRVVEPVVEARFFEIIRASGRREALGEGERRLLEEEVAVGERELVAFRDEPEILNTLGRERFLQGLAVRSSAVDDALRALNSAARRPSASRVQTLGAEWPAMSIVDKRRELRSAIDAVFIRSAAGRQIEERTLVLPTGEGPDDLPRRGRRVPFAAFDWPTDIADAA
jgi:DNA invertase Pin-like site-specific DNA recombinase